MKKGLSVVLATYNEEENIKNCLEAVLELADEIVVVDGSSKDKTRGIAKDLGALVIKTTNPRIFHINKQKALEEAKYEWILQLDADEIVTNELAAEIEKVIEMSEKDIKKHQINLVKRELFLRHQRMVEDRDNSHKEVGGYVGFYVPRLNYFLGKYLRYGGVYPDGVIRLVKNGKAYFPAKDVHEQIVVEGKVGWLGSPLVHMADPTFARYLKRNSKYIDLMVDDMAKQSFPKSVKNSINYFLIKPFVWFVKTQFRHKGILDGWQGVVFSFFSALRFPRAYYRYIRR